MVTERRDVVVVAAATVACLEKGEKIENYEPCMPWQSESEVLCMQEACVCVCVCGSTVVLRKREGDILAFSNQVLEKCSSECI